MQSAKSLSLFSNLTRFFNTRSTHSKKWMRVQTQSKAVHVTTSYGIYKSKINM